MPDAARWSLSGAQAQSIAHNSVFAPPTTLHPYHDLPLGWQQSSKLLDTCQGVNVSDVAGWDKDRVAEFVTSLTGNETCGSAFQQQVHCRNLA